jgi:predicted phage terminase large subunit-like protein
MKSSANELASDLLISLDPVYLIRDVLGYDVEPHHEKILKHITTNKRTCDLAPRGFGKSTIGDIGYCIWRITQDRNIRILIVSNTQSQAEAFLREIKAQLEGNPRLIEMYGSFRSDKWAESEITVSGRTTVAKEATITALGASGSVITKHFDLIVPDDIVDFENARTELQRKKLSEWYRTALLPTLEPHGDIHILGTRYNPLDLYQDVTDGKQYDVQIQSAIQSDGTSLWSSKFPIEILLKIREELGSIIFSMQYQNDISLAKQGKIFRFEWMQFYNNVSELPAPLHQLKIFQGVDLAISERETADYFVIVTIGIVVTGEIYVLDYFRDRISFKVQKETIVLKAAQWQPIRIGIETNQYQRALAQELVRTTTLPIKELDTVKDKVTRAQRRSALFENHKVYLRRDMTAMVDELCLFPDAPHDDLFDGFDFAITVSEQGAVNTDRYMHFVTSKRKW